MIDVPIQIYSDSSAARSVERRRGIGGRLRHFADASFVVAESSGAWSFEVGCEKNPADTLTKPLPGRKIREWSENVGQRWLQQ